jgi:murein DD-endopeptidase MepM/ murein hydrolase activator NlpD
VSDLDIRGFTISGLLHFCLSRTVLLERVVLFVVLSVASACGGGGPATPGQVDSACLPDSSTATRALPVFQKPFVGEFRMSNYFDHNLPMPFANTNGFILTTCGTETRPGIDGHNGYDWELPLGTPVLAVADGEVVTAGYTEPSYCPLVGRNMTQVLVVLKHRAAGRVVVSEYGHLDRTIVRVGTVVPAGTILGFSGTTGCSTGPHLHFSAGIEGPDGSNVLVDPYGWHSVATDPWSRDARGAESVWLWKDGQAPRLR